MKVDIQSIKDSFQYAYAQQEEAYLEAREVYQMNDGAMYTQEQLSILSEKGQPKEHFNVIALFNRSLQGYFSSVVNTIRAKPMEANQTLTANTLNKGLEYFLRINEWESIKDELLISHNNAGLMAVEYHIEKTGEDRYGRDKNTIKINHVPFDEILRDPKSRQWDGSDGRFQHRFRWMHEDEVKQLFPNKINKLTEFSNSTGVDMVDISNHSRHFNGRFRISNEYLIVRSIVVDNKGVSWDVHWSGETELHREKLHFDSLKFPYRVVTHTHPKEQHWHGIYRDVVESQKAINQAVLLIQQLVSSSKVMVEEGAVHDVDQFSSAWMRVNAVIPTLNNGKIQEVDVSRDIQQQYMIIDNALSRIQQVLHVNDSFLGQAFSQDSGKKVALQKNAAMMALRYISTKLDLMYRMIGIDMIFLMRQYIDAEMEIDETNDVTTELNWSLINTPMMDENGQPLYNYTQDDKGFITKKLVNDPTTSFLFDRINVEIESVPYDTDDTADKLMLEQVLQGPAGQFLQQAHPGYYAQIIALLSEQHRTKNSNKVAEIFRMLAQQMGASAIMDPRLIQLKQNSQGGSAPTQTGAPKPDTGAGEIGSVMGLDNNIRNQ